ncbi:hypothetical protein NSK_003558 [Nannochloropsis salina CCMP1776]|uniref:Coiled-coil domain-containing protein 12 n=1 Tax=Nannochloropsis salina CCMP1776 TaxID=1027361 RepID=A0A4D9D6Q1_9STRA|nr:hypothetical protein NSK_003558 [Nannochloropsis salina CCMP1776]|eukprot:TFJ85135.1 hypothetical protein NSK_003558 [Nannochloropsis salina CCMP1776]
MATTSKKPLKFRNYRPADASLVSLSTATSTGSGLVPTGAKSVEDSAAGVPRPNEVRPPPAHAENNQGEEQPKKAEDMKKDEEDAIQRELKRHEAEYGSGGQLNVAPRKANWDLKRDVAKKLAKLNRLTQKAIIEILQEKLAQEAEEGSTSENDDDMSKEGDE